MDDFLDIYTRLKMETDSDIILTYYSSYGYGLTKKFKLIDVVGFSYVLVENEEGKVSIPFFGMDSMIKSITISFLLLLNIEISEKFLINLFILIHM